MVVDIGVRVAGAVMMRCAAGSDGTRAVRECVRGRSRQPRRGGASTRAYDMRTARFARVRIHDSAHAARARHFARLMARTMRAVEPPRRLSFVAAADPSAACLPRVIIRHAAFAAALLLFHIRDVTMPSLCRAAFFFVDARASVCASRC